MRTFQIQSGPSGQSIEPTSEHFGTCLGEESEEICEECKCNGQTYETDGNRWICRDCFRKEDT
jgi:hypothetical protein